MPFGMTTCEKCRKKILGNMVYAGGAVWHRECFPYPDRLRRPTRRPSTKRKLSRSGR